MIVIVVGGIGIAVSAMWMAGQWPFQRRTTIHEREVVEREPPDSETVVHKHGPVRRRHEYFRRSA